jgi:hypothetical protein
MARTLESFSWDVFPNFPIRQVFANIDPAMGDAAVGDRCEALIRNREATQASCVPDLGHDWITLEQIEPLVAPVGRVDQTEWAARPAKAVRFPQKAASAGPALFLPRTLEQAPRSAQWPQVVSRSIHCG